MVQLSTMMSDATHARQLLECDKASQTLAHEVLKLLHDTLDFILLWDDGMAGGQHR